MKLVTFGKSLKMCLKMTCNVFAFEQVNQSLQNAATFGEVKYIFDRNEHTPRASIWDCEALADDIIATLKAKEFNVETDYIVATGHMLHMIQLTAAVITEFGQVKFLLFDAVNKCYVERKLGLPYDD